MPEPTPEPLAWTAAYFSEASGETVAPEADVNYFDAGLIDSVDVIWLIEAAEDAFGIRFSDEHFRDPRFGTTHGLARIIAEASGESGGA